MSFFNVMIVRAALIKNIEPYGVQYTNKLDDQGSGNLVKFDWVILVRGKGVWNGRVL